MGKRNSDTLEMIIADAIEREKRINAEHPERHGYGMIQGEADDLLERMKALEVREELAQREKGNRVKQRIRIANNDRVYSRPPEIVALDNIYKERVNKTEANVVNKLTQRNKEIYDMRDIGNRFTAIGKVVGLHVSNVSRNHKKIMEEMKKQLLKVLSEGSDTYDTRSAYCQPTSSDGKGI